MNIASDVAGSLFIGGGNPPPGTDDLGVVGAGDELGLVNGTDTLGVIT